MEKKCGRCGQTKPASEFARSSKAATGLQSYCRACNVDYSRPWQRAKRSSLTEEELAFTHGRQRDRHRLRSLRAGKWSSGLFKKEAATDPADAFLRLVRSWVEDGDCRLWPGFIRPDGYPEVGNRMAHRLVYEVCVGPIPPGEQIHHKCANRACVNPAHLQGVTQRENVAEMQARNALEARIAHLEAELEALRHSTLVNVA